MKNYIQISLFFYYDFERSCKTIDAYETLKKQKIILEDLSPCILPAHCIKVTLQSNE